MKTKTKTLLLTITFVSALLSGCKTPQTELKDYGHYPMFELNKAITFPAGEARVFFQHGKITQGIDNFEKHCRVEKRSLQDTPQTIQADSFIVTHFKLGEELIAGAGGINEAKQLQLYALNTSGVNHLNHPHANIAFIGENQRPETFDVIHYYLHSASQQDLFRLTCAGSLSNGNPQDYPRSVRPSTKEINAILGEYGQLVTGE